MATDDTPKKDNDLPPQADYELEPGNENASANITMDEMTGNPSQFFAQAMAQTRMAICITDPHKPNNPITFVNQAFLELTGYSRDEVLGRNCDFLQGPETSEDSVQRIRDALADQRVAVVDILNYRKDGTKFWNALHIGPMFDAAGNLTQFYGSQWDVTKLMEERELAQQNKRVTEELKHRTGNLFGVIQSIVAMSGKDAKDVETLRDTIRDRIGALAKAHTVSIAADGDDGDLMALVKAVMLPYQTGCEGRIKIDGDKVELPSNSITPLGLTLHELATNGLKYGALCEVNGHVDIHWTKQEDRVHVQWIESGGPPTPGAPPETTGTGTRIIDGVIKGAGGTVEREWSKDGLRVSLTLPLDQ